VYGIEAMTAEERAAVRLIDLGCGDGGSLRSAQRRFGVEGIGLDREERFVKTGRDNGLAIYQADVLELDPVLLPNVEYVMLDNVLEHMPDLAGLEAVLGWACRTASRMVHVRHPSFEDEEYLASLGLKQYWTDWTAGHNAHTCHARLHEFVEIAGRLGVYRVRIDPVLRSFDSGDPGILPLGAPANQSRIDPLAHGVYDEARHGTKPSVTFDRPVYFAFDLLFLTGPGSPVVRYRADPETDPGRPFFDGWVELGTPAPATVVG
jgi:hypothetical protein